MRDRVAERIERPLCLALLGAFPFPLAQGSQIFFLQQARALMASGSHATLITYARGNGDRHSDIVHAHPPAWLSPKWMRSGPQWGKPLADLGLLITWLRVARAARGAGARFDFVLAHNAEAALIALAARPFTRIPVVYVAHTLLRHELSAYLPDWLGARARQIGARIDTSIARRADGIIALCEEARAELSVHAGRPVALLPPGSDPGAAPSAASVAKTCEKYHLKPGAYVLYSGNRDRYQELDLLEVAATRLPASATPIVVASHAGIDTPPRPSRSPAGMIFVWVENFEEMRRLIHGAQSVIMTRRRRGGFPIKLLNYMAAARPIVAFEGVAVALEDGRSGLLVKEGNGGDEIARALRRLNADPQLRSRLGGEALRTVETEYAWPQIAADTLDYLASLPAIETGARGGNTLRK